MSELELLRRGFETVPEPDEATVHRARLRLLDQIAPPAVPARRPPSRRLFANRRLAVAVGLVVVLALIGTVSLRGRYATISPADAAARICKGSGPASACLKALARVAASQPSLPRVIYQRIEERSPRLFSWHGRRYTVVAVSTVETWLDTARGSAVQRTNAWHLRFPSDRDRLSWKRAGSPSARALFGPTSDRVRAISNADTLFFFDLPAWQRATGSVRPDRSIPTDPEDALRLLTRVWRISGGAGPVGAVADMPLHDPLLRPAQRAALFSALARTQDTRRVMMRDPLGRKGIAVIGPSGYSGLQWITLFDVHTSRVLAEGVQGRNFAGDRTPPPHREWLEIYPAAQTTIPERPKS